MLPPAPGLLSTTKDWPSDLVSSCATARARMSVVPPAGNGTTMRTGLVGQAACANEDSGSRPVANAMPAARRMRRAGEAGRLTGGLLGVLGALPMMQKKKPPEGGFPQACPTLLDVHVGRLDQGAPLVDLGLHELLVLRRIGALVVDHHRAQS